MTAGEWYVCLLHDCAQSVVYRTASLTGVWHSAGWSQDVDEVSIPRRGDPHL